MNSTETPPREDGRHRRAWSLDSVFGGGVSIHCWKGRRNIPSSRNCISRTLVWKRTGDCLSHRIWVTFEEVVILNRDKSPLARFSSTTVQGGGSDCGLVQSLGNVCLDLGPRPSRTICVKVTGALSLQKKDLNLVPTPPVLTAQCCSFWNRIPAWCKSVTTWLQPRTSLSLSMLRELTYTYNLQVDINYLSPQIPYKNVCLQWLLNHAFKWNI